MTTRFTYETTIHGEGGFGKIRKGRDTVLERDVAIKVLNLPSGKFSADDIERFKREAKTLSQQIDTLIRDCILLLDKRLSSARLFGQRLTTAFASNKPLSDVLAHGRLHELAAALEELTASDFVKLPMGQRVLILEKVATVTTSSDQRLIYAAGEMLELLLSRGLLLPKDDYREIVCPAVEWGFGKQSHSQGGRSIRGALESAAYESRGDSHDIIVEEICSKLGSCDWDSEADWFLHAVREITSTLLANPSCTSKLVELRKILRTVNRIQNSRPGVAN